MDNIQPAGGTASTIDELIQLHVAPGKPPAPLSSDAMTAVDRFVRPEQITGNALTSWISRLNKSAADYPWAVIVWPHDYPVSGQLAELRYVRRNMRLSSFVNLRDNTPASPSVATVSMMFVRHKVILDDMVQRSSLLDSAWNMLKDRSPYKKWLCLCDGPKGEFSREAVQDDAERYRSAMAKVPHQNPGLQEWMASPTMRLNLEIIAAATATHRYEQAAENLARLCGKAPNNAWLQNWMGDIRRTSGNPQAALESYQRALELAPRWMEPKWGMAQSLWMNDLVAALPVLDELLLVDPFEERFLSLRIRYCDKHRIPAEYERAELLLRRYVALKPNDGHAWRILGTLLCFNQRFEAAIPCLRRALLHGTGSSWAWNNLAFALAVGGGNLNAAEHACHRALDIDHKTPQFWDTLGVIAMKRGRLADARSAFETALRFAPNAVDTRANLAEACRRLRALSPMGGDTR